MAITARIQNTRSARRTALRAARQERCASATRSSAAVSPVLMEDHPQLEALYHQGSHCRQQTGHRDPGPSGGHLPAYPDREVHTLSAATPDPGLSPLPATTLTD